MARDMYVFSTKLWNSAILGECGGGGEFMVHTLKNFHKQQRQRINMFATMKLMY